jgi:hypothetical protein
MALTRSFAAGREQCFQQIDKLINSHSLRGSESLCKLLRYLAEHSLDNPGVAVKEYQIATEVLGRSGGFDPQNDSTVRVQAGRLRVKLGEYYSHEGPSDPVVVELPKGSYALTFHVRTPPASDTLSEMPSHPRQEHEKPAHPVSSRRWIIALATLTILLAAALAAFAVLLAARSRNPANMKSSIPVPYSVFWGRLASGPEPPWVIFSNANFAGRPETGMRYFDASSDPQSIILDHYTGVGEVIAVHQLDHVFGFFGQQLRVKRGSLFSLDDAKSNDLIFVGSPAENLTLRDLPSTQEFVFQRVTSGPRKGDLGVANIHPLPGEPTLFLATLPKLPVSEDYAVVALVPGIDPSRSVLILAGTTTFGTQAAAEYVCREDSLTQLLQRMGVSRGDDMKPFEAVLHVKVAHGVPVITDLVSVRKRENWPDGQ